MTPVEKSRVAFDALDGESLQGRLSAWQAKNFGPVQLEHVVLGVAEEAGELAHAVLKRAQRIRGMREPETFRAKAGDAIADAAIYLIQAATALRMDFSTLLRETAEDVIRRDWISDPDNGGTK